MFYSIYTYLSSTKAIPTRVLLNLYLFVFYLYISYGKGFYNIDYLLIFLIKENIFKQLSGASCRSCCCCFNKNSVLRSCKLVEAGPRRNKFFASSNKVTRWLVYLFNIWPFTTLKFCQSMFKFWQILYKHFKIAKCFSNSAKSGRTVFRPQL